MTSIVTILLKGRVGNRLQLSLIEKGIVYNAEFTTQELIDFIDDNEDNTLVSNDIVILELSQFTEEEKNAYKNYRLHKAETLLDGWDYDDD